ncbi:DUF4199 domain-containing protein [Aquimarina mytili]|uniref:DUF4199 domain-containing protein n=1 Tax=Aquimarina mytili TaxID=874423 RepID=A0A937DD69_9FLAO|nr:DUF4199 domain-containing protein [Aquimarina mytili]MBL0685706.1 DUF4199 domain-containing protein [Aquimarina mytili]
MKSNNISTRKFIIKYGLILGAIWIIYYFIKYLVINSVYNDGGYIFSMITEIGLHILLAYPIYQYKLINNGFLTLIQALKIGMSIALIVSLIAGIYFIFVIKIIEPEEVLQRANDAKETMLNNNPDMSP